MFLQNSKRLVFENTSESTEESSESSSGAAGGGGGGDGSLLNNETESAGYFVSSTLTKTSYKVHSLLLVTRQSTHQSR